LLCQKITRYRINKQQEKKTGNQGVALPRWTKTGTSWYPVKAGSLKEDSLSTLPTVPGQAMRASELVSFYAVKATFNEVAFLLIATRVRLTPVDPVDLGLYLLQLSFVFGHLISVIGRMRFIGQPLGQFEVEVIKGFQHSDFIHLQQCKQNKRQWTMIFCAMLRVIQPR
jgi:hypothetical protein